MCRKFSLDEDTLESLRSCSKLNRYRIGNTTKERGYLILRRASGESISSPVVVKSPKISFVS